jgi:hypothetical protein
VAFSRSQAHRWWLLLRRHLAISPHKHHIRRNALLSQTEVTPFCAELWVRQVRSRRRTPSAKFSIIISSVG